MKFELLIKDHSWSFCCTLFFEVLNNIDETKISFFQRDDLSQSENLLLKTWLLLLNELLIKAIWIVNVLMM